MEKLKELYAKYKEQILYLFFGGFTTIVSLGSYWICTEKIGLSITISYWISWILAVLFAFVTNKLFVFDSKKTSEKKTLFELLTFFACRIFTGLIGNGFLKLTVDMLHWHNMLMKLISSVIEVVLNYVFSKLIVFRKKTDKQASADPEKNGKEF
ncbi:MAG: GtrA family protein [Eubacteriales bacterium]